MKIKLRPSRLKVRRQTVKWIIVHHTHEMYKQPESILVLRLPADADEVKHLGGSQSRGRSSFLVAETFCLTTTSVSWQFLRWNCCLPSYAIT